MMAIGSEYYYKTATGFARSFVLPSAQAGFISIDDVEQIVDGQRREGGKEPQVHEVKQAAINLAKQRQKGRGSI